MMKFLIFQKNLSKARDLAGKPAKGPFRYRSIRFAHLEESHL